MVKDNDKVTDLFKYLKWIAAIAAIVAVFVALFYLIKFRGGLSPDQTRWGEFGDYIGGVLNPIFGFLGLIALLLTIALQAKELKLSRKELRNSSNALKAQNGTLIIQNFESSFFQMLRLHNDIVNSIDFVNISTTITTSGRDCFPVMVDRLKGYLKSFQNNRQIVEKYYEDFYKQHQGELGHYFRYLYNIFKFIDNSNIENKKFYSNLVRAQLSNHELVILFYNCFSKYGNNKFLPLAKKYSLFKNMPTSILIQESHIDWLTT